jgi:hypothetical protein
VLLVTLEFLTPRGALLALVVLLPLAAFLGVSKRAARVRETLGIPDLPETARLVPLGALAGVGALLALAAAQPLVESSAERSVRSDAEAYVVLDVSRSMLARQGLQGPMRIDRARQAAERLRASLPDVKVGVASLTNRVLPHLFPSADAAVFRATLERSVDIERPAPGTGFILAPGQVTSRNATAFTALAALGTNGFFSPEARNRVVVVLTDGESSDISLGRIAESFRDAGISPVFLRFWGANERVFTNGVPESQYRPQPESRAILETLAGATGGESFDERDYAAAERQVRAGLGAGAADDAVSERGHRVPLAPYLAVAAFLPLGLLLWQRDR